MTKRHRWSPSSAVKPAMHLTSNGWVKDENTDCLKDPVKILDYCKQVSKLLVVNIFTVRNEVAKVMFLHLSVIHSVQSGHRSGRYASYWNYERKIIFFHYQEICQ